MSFKDRSTYYVPTWDGASVKFIIDFLWWVMVINLLVALFNMLPLGILDGGRFFYLAVEKVTGEKTAVTAFSWMTKFIVFIFILLMAIWAYRILGF